MEVRGEDRMEQKMQKYEAFIDEKLKPDLSKVLVQRETLYKELSQ